MYKGNFVKEGISAILVILCCACVSSCSNHTDEQAGECLVTLKLTLPQDEAYDMNTPAGRAGSVVPGDPEESKITSLKFMLFKTGQTTPEVYKDITIDSGGNSSDPMWDPVNNTLRVAVAPGYKEIYCLVNWTDGGSGMAAITESQATITLLGNQTRGHTNFNLSNPPVMTAYMGRNIAGDEQDLPLNLTRQVARVEFSFLLSETLRLLGTDVKIHGVCLTQQPSLSYVFPRLVAGSPSGTTVWTSTTFFGTVSASLTATAAYYRLLYTPEYYPASASNATVAIIHAEYNGKATYYPIVINPAENTTYTHSPYAIERNHTYQYTVTIDGLGNDSSSSIEPARSANAGLQNFTYTLDIK